MTWNFLLVYEEWEVFEREIVTIGGTDVNMANFVYFLFSCFDGCVYTLGMSDRLILLSNMDIFHSFCVGSGEAWHIAFCTETRGKGLYSD